MKIDNYKVDVLLSESDILDCVKKLGEDISRDYENRNLLVVPLLNGAFMFASDLVRAISVPLRVEFFKTSSYGDSTSTTGEVKIKYAVDMDYSEYDVLIVDDIVDSGITLKKIVKHFEDLHVASVKTCVLLDKKERREVDINVNYIGLEIPNKFVVGYGLDYAYQYRNLTCIYALEEIAE